MEDSTDPAGSGARDITNFGLLLSGPTVLTVQDCTVWFEQDHNQYEMRVDKDFDGTRFLPLTVRRLKKALTEGRPLPSLALNGVTADADTLTLEFEGPTRMVMPNWLDASAK